MKDPLTNYFNFLNGIKVETEKKNGLTYVPWAVAWDALKSQDPNANYQVHKFHDSETGRSTFVNQDGLVMVTVDAFGHSHTMHLPVMDYRNDAIEDPDSTDINNAIMRCFTKAMAMHGIGLYPYRGEDVPKEKPKFSADQVRKLREAASEAMEADDVDVKDIQNLYKQHQEYDALLEAIQSL